ncbi:MAG: hypothetical protein AAGD25_39125 [Cyanobacteria bacterium P01_F01_bin.150]
MIRCERSSTTSSQSTPATIRCTRTRTEYWGLISTKPLTIENIVGAALDEERQGRVTAYWVTLQANE